MITIKHYNPAWPQEFEVIRSTLQKILGPLALCIDHIGSTSIPGMAAKDVIDVQVTVQELSPEITRKMIEARFVYRPDNTHDHVPFGEDENPWLWAKLCFEQPDGQRRANIHARMVGNLNQRYALLFRDYLRTHPNSAKTVESIKRQLAKYHAGDVDAYYDIKDPVYDLIWYAALDWGKQTRWR